MDFTDILKQVAPGLATALLGPLGGLAVSAIGKALDIPDATQESIKQAISGASPEDLRKLKEADQQFIKDMKALDIDVFRIEVGDRDSARKLAMSGDTTARNLAYLIVGAFVGMCFAVLYDVAKVDSVLAGTIIGYLSAKAEQVASFYFGSSSSSQKKDATISKLAG